VFVGGIKMLLKNLDGEEIEIVEELRELKWNALSDEGKKARARFVKANSLFE
jgi:hypothetical protein